MKSNDLYAKLELICSETEPTIAPDYPPRRPIRSPIQKLLVLAQNLQKWIAGWAEPHINQHCDRQGNTYYEIYDPVSRQRFHCESETEVRAWLEQRYYRQ